MIERWIRIGIVATALYAISAASQLAVRFWFAGDATAEDRVALVALGALGLTTAVLAAVWGRLRPVGVVMADLSGAGAVALALHVFVSPFLRGETPAQVGLNGSIASAGLFVGFAGAGMVIGLWLLMMVGRDYKSQGLKRYADARLTKPGISRTGVSKPKAGSSRPGSGKAGASRPAS